MVEIHEKTINKKYLILKALKKDRTFSFYGFAKKEPLYCCQDNGVWKVGDVLTADSFYFNHNPYYLVVAIAEFKNIGECAWNFEKDLNEIDRHALKKSCIHKIMYQEVN